MPVTRKSTVQQTLAHGSPSVSFPKTILTTFGECSPNVSRLQKFWGSLGEHFMNLNRQLKNERYIYKPSCSRNQKLLAGNSVPNIYSLISFTNQTKRTFWFWPWLSLLAPLWSV